MKLEIVPKKKPVEPMGRFWCEVCKRETLHHMIAGGWKKGACFECEFRAAQLPLFPEKGKQP